MVTAGCSGRRFSAEPRCSQACTFSGRNGWCIRVSPAWSRRARPICGAASDESHRCPYAIRRTVMEQRTRPSPRLAPLPAERSPELKDDFAAIGKSLGFVPNSVLIMQRKPALVKALRGLLATIWDPQSEVDRGFKRLVAHVASRAAGCQ